MISPTLKKLIAINAFNDTIWLTWPKNVPSLPSKLLQRYEFFMSTPWRKNEDAIELLLEFIDQLEQLDANGASKYKDFGYVSQFISGSFSWNDVKYGYGFWVPVERLLRENACNGEAWDRKLANFSESDLLVMELSGDYESYWHEPL